MSWHPRGYGGRRRSPEQVKGRASIAAAGFSRKWQNALRANV